MELLPLDLNEILHEELLRDNRPNDGLLHASSHLDSPLRHTQLDVVGAPQLPKSLIDLITLKTGTLWHEWIHDALRRLGVPYMAEVNLTPWLPAGWAGTADAVIFNPELKGFVLVDFKTQKGEGMSWIEKGGAKEAHKLQTSAYWHALKRMGLPMVKQLAIWYVPKNDVRGRDTEIVPLLVDFEPYPAKKLHALMEERRQAVQRYRDSLPPTPEAPADWVTPELVPESQPEQRLYFDRETGGHQLKLIRHWSADYCSFDPELCGCSLQQKTEKIGFFDVDGSYYPRKGYEHITPAVEPPVG